ncbi:MAG: hypothetical protein GXO43_04950 [Crenarchaeota archaeon]|nr:hypothetical protein [Thermoproteota archaeon]
MHDLPQKTIVLAMLIFIIFSITPVSVQNTYSERTALSSEYLSLNINYSDNGMVSISLDSMGLPDNYENNTVIGTTSISIDGARIVSKCNITSKPRSSGSLSLPEIKVDLVFSSEGGWNIAFYHFKVKTMIITQTEKKSEYAESYLIYLGYRHPVIKYNVTGTDDIASQFLIGMIRRMIFNPLLATNISENKVSSGGNITIRGQADVINASYIINGEMSFTAVGRPVKGAVKYEVRELRLTYNATASYLVPVYKLLNEILLKGLHGYKGEQAGTIFLTPFLAGLTTVTLKGGSNIINDILTISLTTNATSIKAKLSSSNNTYKLTMNAYGSTDHQPPDILVSLIASTRGYEATNTAKLLTILHEVKPGGKADPEKLLSNALRILGKPIYSYSPEAYTSNQSSLTIILPNTINETVVDLLENIAAILHVRTTFTIENNKITKITVKPYPSIREAIAIYMALNNIGITTSPAKTTVKTTTTTQAPTQTTTTTTTTTISPAGTTTTSPPITTTTTKHTTVARTTQPATTSQAKTAGQLPTTTSMNNGGPGLSPLLALIPLAILGLIILYLHIKAKKRMTETLLGQPEETGEETEESS